MRVYTSTCKDGAATTFAVDEDDRVKIVEVSLKRCADRSDLLVLIERSHKDVTEFVLEPVWRLGGDARHTAATVNLDLQASQLVHVLTRSLVEAMLRMLTRPRRDCLRIAYSAPITCHRIQKPNENRDHQKDKNTRTGCVLSSCTHSRDTLQVDRIQRVHAATRAAQTVYQQ